jgi:pimeloyl-ACP methyl ester carboxylesterase
MTNVAADAGEITGLVYVNGLAPAPGENCFGLAGMFPGSMVGEETVWPVPRRDGTTDFYIAPASFHDVFCADVSGPRATLMAATQRPATQEALVEPSGGHSLWKDVPSWFLIGEEDRIIPAALQRFEAERADARRVVEIPGASHAATVSQPRAVAELILEAIAPVHAGV